MSFEVLNSNAELSVGGLFLRTESVRDIPLDSFSATMSVDGPSTCTCIPCTGMHNTGVEIRPDIITRIKPYEKCTVVANVKTKDGSRDKKIFVGRLLGTDLNVNTNAYQSTSGVVIALRHVAEADLMGTAIGQRVYYKAGAEVPKQFRINEDVTSMIENTALQTASLRGGKIAVYLKELITALLRWYTDNSLGQTGYNVEEILKAVPCVVRPEIKQIAMAEGSMSKDTLPSSMAKAVDSAIKGALSSKASLLSLLSTLSTFCMLSLIPTRESLVISPVLDVCRFNESDGPTIKRRWITGVQNPFSQNRFPIERVVLNKKFGGRYLGGIDSVAMTGKLQTMSNRYSYPENEALGAILVDPPPLLAGLIDCAASIGKDGTEPKTIDEGGTSATDVNSAGASPVELGAAVENDLGSKAAKLMWSKLAYAHHSITIDIIPHWIFSDRYQDDIKWTYDELSPWGMLAHTVSFASPFKTAVREDTEDDTTYTGYVKSMKIAASVENATLTTSANLTNVRTQAEDTFSSAMNANPLYDTEAGQQPV